MDNSLEEEVLHLYQNPMIGASYTNTYGEENIRNLVGKYRSLNEPSMQEMLEMLEIKHLHRILVYYPKIALSRKMAGNHDFGSRNL